MLRTIELSAVVFVLCHSLTFGTLTYNDGRYHVIDKYFNDAAEIDFQMPNMRTTLEIAAGGQINDIFIFQHGTLILSEGKCGYLYLYDNSQAYVNGNHGRLSLANNSIMHIYYSKAGSSLTIGDSSKVFLYGYDFKVDGQPVGYGTYSTADLPFSTPDQIGFFYYRLSGYFENGSSFSYYLSMQGENTRITFIPEPATILLLGLGVAGMRIKRTSQTPHR